MISVIVCLCPVVSHSCCKVDYTYNFNMQRFQIVDQFLWSEQRFCEAVMNYDVIHDVSNISDHEPILLNMELAVTRYDSI